MLWFKGIKTLGLLILALTLLIGCILLVKPYFAPKPYLLKCFSFSNEEDLKEWSEKVFRGHVEYKIERFLNDSCIYARSKNNASALYYKIKAEIGRHPILSWRWKVIKFPEKRPNESLINSEEDDYGTRIYVIFPSIFLSDSKVLEYVWTEHIPKGTISSSPYTSNIKLIVLESGYNGGNNWIYEKRDLYEDYVKAFGQEPKLNIGAIAFMTDSDSTGSSAEAVYDEIKIEYKKEMKP